MTITLDGAREIVGLALEGKVVSEGFKSSIYFEELYILVKDCLGWSKDESEEKFEIGVGALPKAKREFKESGEHRDMLNPARKINLVRLRNKFEKSDAKDRNGMVVMDEVRARHTTIAYLLHALGTVFFPKFPRNKVNACYL